MDHKKVKMWFDPEADYLEVIFEDAEGFFRETDNDQVMEKVAPDGRVLGFSIMKVSSMRKEPFAVAL